MVEDYMVRSIRPWITPDHPTRLALLLAYRDGLRISPQVAWDAALRIARERFPTVEERNLRRMLLYALGLFGAKDRERVDSTKAPNLEGRMPCWIEPRVSLRLGSAARHYGLTIDELVSRVLGGWIEAACDFDGVPIAETPEPPPI